MGLSRKGQHSFSSTMVDYYSISANEAILQLHTSSNGLTSQEAKKRLIEYGPNELKKEKKRTAFSLYMNQFKDGLILLLVFAGALSLALGELVEAIAIAVIILLNTLLGFIQEYKAEKAIEALKKISAPMATVIRDGKEHKIPARELVPGDILVLEAGDIVAADSRLFEIASLQIDEASLTGESVPSKKVIDPFSLETSVTDQENMAFMGTIVTYGKGKSVVTQTGMNTEFGRIADSLQTTKDVQTPLQLKFNKLAKQIGITAVILIIIVLVAGTLQGTLTFGKMLLIALTLTVAVVPNALPLVVTAGLSMGTKRLVKKNMLVKKLSAAEGLGACTIIVSDKTGTITKNQMTITRIYTDRQTFFVSGTGYEPEGKFFTDAGTDEKKEANPQQFELLLRIGYLCNSAKLTADKGKLEIIGDPTEGSLIVLGKKGRLEEEDLHEKYTFLQEIPFDSDRKRMSVIFFNKITKSKEAYVKGAPDILLSVCDRILENGKIRKLTKKDRDFILQKNDSFAEQALRVLGLAYTELADTKTDDYDYKTVEKNLIFVGLVGMIDPPRDEIKPAIEQCTRAGIKVMMITGDHAVTARAVARQIGMFKEGDIVLTGDDVEKMSDDELGKKMDHIRIIARALPIQKSRIVDILQKKGHIVAMTGDGVNDAPALKKANIGIAMGITGTDVAKEVAKAILIDDNFATIVNAIEEGRNIYDKIIKSAKFFLSCNAGEIISVFLAIMFRLPIPLLPLQILMINMLTDNFPALGLGFESPEEGIMERSPRNPKDNPISKSMFITILIFGALMGAGTLLLFMHYSADSLIKAQTVAFTTLVMFQMFAVMSSRTLYFSPSHLNPFSNLWLLGGVFLSVIIQIIVIYWQPAQAIFGTVPLLLLDWIKIIGISSMGFVLMEVSKIVLGLKTQNPQKTSSS
ncbi:MAG: cation-translocating P-type ATPase [Nanoarchaeota archaeon]